MTGKRSEIRKRPPTPASERADPLGAMLSPGGYFREGNMVVRRSELQGILQVLERARRRQVWYRRLWRWLMSPFVKTPTMVPVVLQENRGPRGKFDASGKAIEAESEKQPDAPKSSIEIASR